MSSMQDWHAVREVIENNKSFIIFTHISADGDALSSAFSLALFLKSRGKRTFILLEEEPQSVLKYITEQDICFDIYDSEKNYGSYDVSISVDTASEERLGRRREIYFSSPVTVYIDHHLSKNPYAQINVCNPMWASCSEGIWELMHTYGNITDKIIAQTVFAGLMTDTGCFAYSNTTANTHLIAARIIELCSDQSWQYRQIFESVDKSELDLRRIAYSKLEFYHNDTICMLEITQSDMDECKATREQLESFAPFLRTIRGVKTGIFIKPGDTLSQRRISLRSDSSCNVSKIAACFGGGGHACAAGITYSPDKMDMTLEEFKLKLVEDIIAWTE